MNEMTITLELRRFVDNCWIIILSGTRPYGAIRGSESEVVDPGLDQQVQVGVDSD